MSQTELIKYNSEIILASGSETRRMMLANVNLNCSLTRPKIDEERIKEQECQGMSATEEALYLARVKALSVSRTHKDAYVIGADQVCEMNGEVFNKPGSLDNCVKHLQKLRNKTHNQNCATVIAKGTKILWEFIATAKVSIRNLSDSEIYAYVKAENPINACGSYKLESFGKHIFSKLEGDHDVILGLPTLELLNKLYELKAIEFKV